MMDADHQETSPDAILPVISKLSCSLSGQIGMVMLAADSQAARIYGSDRAEEDFACNYGVNPLYQDRLRSEDLKISGYDDSGAVRIVELKSSPFYIATLFVPQLRSAEGSPHPLFTAFVKAASEHRF